MEAQIIMVNKKIMKLKKGSKEAKAYMAKIRAKRATKSKIKPKPSRIDDLLLLDEIKGRAKRKVGSTLKLHKKEIRLGMPPKTRSNNPKKYHKDTKSHNVNIRVVSGSPRLSIIEKKHDVLDRIKHLVKYNDEVEQLLLRWKDRLKTDKSKPFVDFQKKNVQENIKKYTVLLRSNKKYLSELKKLI
jgi:hypothetical protein